jgi:hypothetical protein
MERMISIIDKEMDDACYDRLGKDIAKKLHAAGYRLDPYPNGKSKDELIKRIEMVEAERDRARNLLRETDLLLRKRCSVPGQTILSQSEESRIDMNRAFLAETSGGKG